jgi:hypothetical protein
MNPMSNKRTEEAGFGAATLVSVPFSAGPLPNKLNDILGLPRKMEIRNFLSA